MVLGWTEGNKDEKCMIKWGGGGEGGGRLVLSPVESFLGTPTNQHAEMEEGKRKFSFYGNFHLFLLQF